MTHNTVADSLALSAFVNDCDPPKLLLYDTQIADGVTQFFVTPASGKADYERTNIHTPGTLARDRHAEVIAISVRPVEASQFNGTLSLAIGAQTLSYDVYGDRWWVRWILPAAVCVTTRTKVTATLRFSTPVLARVSLLLLLRRTEC